MFHPFFFLYIGSIYHQPSFRRESQASSTQSQQSSEDEDDDDEEGFAFEQQVVGSNGGNNHGDPVQQGQVQSQLISRALDRNNQSLDSTTSQSDTDLSEMSDGGGGERKKSTEQKMNR